MKATGPRFVRTGRLSGATPPFGGTSAVVARDIAPDRGSVHPSQVRHAL